MNLELKKRQDFLTMLLSFIACRGLFRSPIAKDSVWLEIPLDRKADAGYDDLVGELLIVPKKGYYYEQIKGNMPHIGKLLSIKVPNHTCQAILKTKSYPLYFLSESQELVDLFFADKRIMELFTKSENEWFWNNLFTVHMTD